jgi:endonuclease IV
MPSRRNKKIPPFGYHVTKEKHPSIYDAIRDADVNGAVQIFTHNPRGYGQNIDKDDIKKLKKLNEITDMQIFVHLPYVMSPWNKKNSAVQSMLSMLRVAKQINSPGAVVHLKTASPNEISEALRYAMSTVPKGNLGELAPLLLEMPARKPVSGSIGDDDNGNYNRSDHMVYLMRKIKQVFLTKGSGVTRAHYRKIGICVDTAHVFSSGIDITTAAGARRWWNGFRNRDKKEKIKLVHLNGIYRELGSGTDKHAVIFHKNDSIWGNIDYEQSGCKFLIEKFVKYRIPIVMEINTDFDARPGAMALLRKNICR